MTELEYVKGILDELLDHRLKIAPGSLAAKAFNFVKDVDSYIMDNVYERTYLAISKCGEIIDHDPNLEVIMGLITVQKMPCVIVCRVEDGRAYLTAYAYEPALIKQVPLKALQKLKRNL